MNFRSSDIRIAQEVYMKMTVILQVGNIEGGALGGFMANRTPIERKRSIEICQLSAFRNQEKDSKRKS
jgi:hypothetical protein